MSSHAATKEVKKLRQSVDALGSARPRPSDRATKKEEKDGAYLALHRWFYVSDKKSRRAVAARRSYPIMAYVGPNGGGKSACMVYDTIPSLRRGRTVLSTVKLVDPRTGRPFPNYVKFESWDQLVDLKDADVLMDEMVGIAGSRESQKLDMRVQNVLVQLRRRNIVLRWSAPNWARADKIVREVTQSVTECRGYFPSRVAKRAGDDDAVQLWAPKRLFRFRTFDTIDFEEWTSGKRDKLEPIAGEYFYGPGSTVFDTYDTLDAVSMVAGITPEGLCDICMKTARKEYCKGHTDAEMESHRHGDVFAVFEEEARRADQAGQLETATVK